MTTPTVSVSLYGKTSRKTRGIGPTQRGRNSDTDTEECPVFPADKLSTSSTGKSATSHATSNRVYTADQRTGSNAVHKSCWRKGRDQQTPLDTKVLERRF